MTLRKEIKKAIRDEMDRSGVRASAWSSTNEDSFLERTVDEIEHILKRYAQPVTVLSANTTPLVSADPLGAERKAREL